MKSKIILLVRFCQECGATWKEPATREETILIELGFEPKDDNDRICDTCKETNHVQI